VTASGLASNVPSLRLAVARPGTVG
jgi:hypothetical protein